MPVTDALLTLGEVPVAGLALVALTTEPLLVARALPGLLVAELVLGTAAVAVAG